MNRQIITEAIILWWCIDHLFPAFSRRRDRLHHLKEAAKVQSGWRLPATSYDEYKNRRRDFLSHTSRWGWGGMATSQRWWQGHEIVGLEEWTDFSEWVHATGTWISSKCARQSWHQWRDRLKKVLARFYGPCAGGKSSSSSCSSGWRRVDRIELRCELCKCYAITCLSKLVRLFIRLFLRRANDWSGICAMLQQ